MFALAVLIYIFLLLLFLLEAPSDISGSQAVRMVSTVNVSVCLFASVWLKLELMCQVCLCSVDDSPRATGLRPGSSCCGRW